MNQDHSQSSYESTFRTICYSQTLHAMHIECLHLSHGASRVMPHTSQVSSKLRELELDTMMHTVRACTFLQAGMQQLVKNLSHIGGMKQASLRYSSVGVKNCSNFCSGCGGCLGESPRLGNPQGSSVCDPAGQNWMKRSQNRRVGLTKMVLLMNICRLC